MELIFLDEQTLSVLDHAYCSSDYEIVLDALVPQKSKFTVAGQNLNISIGDLLYIRGIKFPYIGIIISIEEDDAGRTKIQTNDFLSLFDIEVPVPTSFNGNAADFIVNLIQRVYRNSTDNFQTISYLQTAVEVVKTCNLKYDANTKLNILDLVEEFSKTYGIMLEYEIITTQGVYSGIKVKVVSSAFGATLRSDLATISELKINDTNEISLNKIVYVPNADNTSHTSVISYYLLDDGTVTTNLVYEGRNNKVKVKFEFYGDTDYDSLLTKATKDLIDSSMQHSITFNFSFVANKIESLSNLRPGTILGFVSSKKFYTTIVSKLEFKGSFDIAKVTLGEYRLSLTDKIKLTDRRNK